MAKLKATFLKMSKPLFLIVILSGIILNLTELALSTKKMSICSTASCSLAYLFVADKKVLLIAGLTVFTLIFVIELLSKEIPKARTVTTALLIVAMTVEGYLLAFQKLVLQNFCLFCILIASLFVMASALRSLTDDRRTAFGFITATAVATAMWIVNPSFAILPRNSDVLIYSDNCPYCAEIVELCKLNNAQISLVPVEKVKTLCHAFNISSVPVLIRKDFNSQTIHIITSKQKIVDYITSNIKTQNAEKPKTENGSCQIYQLQNQPNSCHPKDTFTP